MNILVLHGLGNDLALARGSSVSHLMCFEKHAPQHRYIYQDLSRPVTQHLREFPFDAILIDGTFLCWRWVRPRHLLAELKEKYSWIAQNQAAKIAFPQDDYDHSAVLDRWMAEWNVDSVLSVCPSHHEELYPLMSKRPGALGVGLTGYVDDDVADRLGSILPRPLARRSIAVGYRARDLPAYYGTQGHTKSRLGRDFQVHASRHGLKVDVSVNQADVLLGDAWTKFLEDSRFTLGCESGSSVLDKEGEIRDAVDAYVIRHPLASFEQIASEVFPGQDGRLVFSAVSPRVFEAASLGSCQILMEGTYLPEMQAGVHYIEIKKDWSNINTVFSTLDNLPFAQEMANRCIADIITPATYRYSTRVASVFELIASTVAARKFRPDTPSTEEFNTMAQKHMVESDALAAADARHKELEARKKVLERNLATIKSPRLLLSRVGSAVNRLIRSAR